MNLASNYSNFSTIYSSEFKMTDIKGSTSVDVNNHTLHREWDEISCAICMDHPHNAVLLVCSSHEKGCRSYICDTSYRHSNCLDRFKNHRDNPLHSPHFVGNAESSIHGQRSLRSLTPEPVFSRHRVRGDLTGTSVAYNVEESSSGISRSIFEALEETNSQEAETFLETRGQGRLDLQDFDGGSSISKNSTLRCPLCRGSLLGYRIEKEVRQYLDQKPRSCSRESCAFSGNYTELRRHARRAHPTTRPADVDPSRRRAWRHLEREQEIGDVISALHSTSPGAIVIGDYVIDSGDELLHDRENSGPGSASRTWRTTLLLLQVLREPSNLSRSWRTRRRSGHRNVWDVDPLDLEDDENNSRFLDGDGVPVPRRRRRFRRSRSDDDGHER